jgi:hypothetical protein
MSISFTSTSFERFHRQFESGYMSTYRLVIAGSDERIVWVLARLQDNARQIFELIFGVGGIQNASHDGGF